MRGDGIEDCKGDAIFGGSPRVKKLFLAIYVEVRTSAFARISQPVAIERERIRTNFVFPIRPSTPSTMSSVREVSSFSSPRLGREPIVTRYVAEVPNATPSDRRSSVLGRDENDIIDVRSYQIFRCS